jgi:hypothetical protein
MPLPSSPTLLLSHIYTHLATNIEHSSPPHIIATLAYILTSTSNDYIQQVCHSVGYGCAEPLHRAHRITGEPEDEEEQICEFVLDAEESYPSFFPPELTDALPTAKKSLVLLRGAQSDHPLLQRSLSSQPIQWLWTEAEVKTAQEHISVGNERQVNFSVLKPVSRYKSDIEEFTIFDQEPGTHLCSPSFTPQTFLCTFLATFPHTLPSSTPTFRLLTSCTFSPLVAHTSSLSKALLSLFLSPSSHLNLRIHLTLLRSYLLLTSHSFKSRLSAALFSNSEDGESDTQGMRTFVRPSRPPRSNVDSLAERGNSWAIGLAPSLTARQSWPPGGADLSFHLRTVIVDSLELGFDEPFDDGEKKGTQRVLGEAEARLGFAIHDLPVGGEKDRWLNPLCM